MSLKKLIVLNLLLSSLPAWAGSVGENGTYVTTKIVESVVNVILTPFGTTTDVSSQEDKRALLLAREDAREFLLGAEMTERLQEGVFLFRSYAKKSAHSELAEWTDYEIVREIYIFSDEAISRSDEA